MNLREQLRNEWSQYIRPLMVKEECEWCGRKDDLHLHHIDRFHNLLVETLEELQLQELDTEDYEEFELKQISNFMLAKQLKSEYKTLCRECHLKLHAKEKFTEEYKNHYYNPNGGYIQLSSELFELEGLSPNTLIRFIRLCCNTTYDGIVKNKRNKAIISNGLADYLIKKLNLSRAEVFNFIGEAKKFNLFEFKNDMIYVNKDYAQKGFVDFKRVVKIFDRTFNELYDSINSGKHKIAGMIIKAYTNKIDTYNEDYFGKNITRFSVLIEELNLGKMNKRSVYYNPNILYSGSLDYSYEDVINKFNDI